MSHFLHHCCVTVTYLFLNQYRTPVYSCTHRDTYIVHTDCVCLLVYCLLSACNRLALISFSRSVFHSLNQHHLSNLSVIVYLIPIRLNIISLNGMSCINNHSSTVMISGSGLYCACFSSNMLATELSLALFPSTSLYLIRI